MSLCQGTRFCSSATLFAVHRRIAHWRLAFAVVLYSKQQLDWCFANCPLRLISANGKTTIATGDVDLLNAI
jgi:hypothetical protein